MTVAPEQLAEWRKLCERWNADGALFDADESDLWEMVHAARLGWPATMDALEAVTAERVLLQTISATELVVRG